jgi:hypothetical protein
MWNMALPRQRAEGKYPSSWFELAFWHVGFPSYQKQTPLCFSAKSLTLVSSGRLADNSNGTG